MKTQQAIVLSSSGPLPSPELSKISEPLKLAPKSVLKPPDGTKPVALGSGVVTRILSKGGSAIVYEIWNAHLEVKRAVKLLDPAHVKQSRERFETEIKISAKLHHPNIVEIYGVGKWNDLPYIEMERIDGFTLENLIANHGALPAEVCTAIAIFVSRALHHAHNQKYMIFGKEYHGIIHRDLKPANIMLNETGNVKLMDFGVAKPMEASNLTMDGMVVGTLQYLSPEQLQGGAIDARADIYSFGAVIYELLTGFQTFPEKNIGKLVSQKLANNYRPLDEFTVKVPPKLRAVVHKCLQFEQEKRIQNSLLLVKNLEAIHAGLTHRTPQETLLDFVRQTHANKIFVGTRRCFPLAALIAWTLVACLLTSAAWFGAPLLKRFSRAGAAAPPLSSSPSAPPEAAPAYVPAPAPEPVQPQITMVSSKPALSAVRRSFIKKETLPMRAAAPAPSKILAENSAPTPAPKPIDPAQLTARLENAMHNNDYQLASEIIAGFPSELYQTKKIRIMQLRILQNLENAPALKAFLTALSVPDAEFYLAKSLHYCRAKDSLNARQFFELGAKTPGEFCDAAALNQARMYGKAVYTSLLFDQTPSAATKKEAMDNWYDLKVLLQSSPDNRFYRRADAEIRRINGMSTGGSL
ncbi:MAG: serine/threonine-protein kinase [Chitinivibrionales bacterium]|nr:serine/threonine-protein kinase [Chitinivibrionales bacterium]